MRLLFIIFLVLGIVGGAGFGLYTYVLKPAEASETDQVDEVKKAEKPKIKVSNYEFVELDPLILPIIDQNGFSQTVSMIVAIEVRSTFHSQFVNSVQPKIKDAFIQEMYGYLNKETALNPGGAIKVKYLKERLNKVTLELLGPDIVNDVLLTVVQQRPA